MSNQDLQATHGFDPEWIVNRTGIHERRFALPHQATSDLCTQAAIRCLEAAGREPGDVDLLVRRARSRPTWRSRPRRTWFRIGSSWSARPSTSRRRVRVSSSRWSSRPSSSARGTADVPWSIGGDCNSRVINPGDQKSFPLFGDGAGAVLLAPGEPDQGLVAYQLGSDGSGGDLLSRPACGSRIPPSAAALEQGLHYLTMDGRAVFKWAVRILADSSLAVLAHANCQVRDIRWFIPHQANVRIIHAASDVLGFHRDAVFKNLERYGNTSAGSIPIALDELIPAGRDPAAATCS